MLTRARFVRRFSAIPVAILALALLACGSDAEADPTPTAAPSTPTSEATQPSGDGGSRVATDGDSVLVHYHGTLDDGEVFDSSLERDPFSFVIGAGRAIQGFDNAVRGMAVGETVSVRIPPAEAYGEVDESVRFEFAIEQAPDGLEVDDQVFVRGIPMPVVEINDDHFVVDGNHPLAGKALTFEIELVEIQ